MFPHPSLQVDGFNCQHVNWSYNTTSPDGENLASWAAANNIELLHNSKGAASFSSRRLNVGTNLELAFASVLSQQFLADIVPEYGDVLMFTLIVFLSMGMC